MCLFRRKKKIVPPLERTPDEQPFQVFEILDEHEKKAYQKNRFVSPIFGHFAKDEIVIPNHAASARDLDKLDPFRTKPKMTNEERIKKYGTAYPEFKVIRGRNLQEALESQEKPVSARIVDETEPSEIPQETPAEDLTENLSEETTAPASRHEETVSGPAPEKPRNTPVKTPVEPSGSFVKANIHQDKAYQNPSHTLFSKPSEDKPDLKESIEQQTDILNRTLEEFQIGGKVMRHTQGPTVTRYELALESGVNVKRIHGIADNLKMALAATNIRIEAPIPGKSTVGVEVPNVEAETVHFIDIINASMFKKAALPLTVALGLDIDGNPVYTSIKSMPHGLVAGATGSGKSVCIHTILMSLLIKYSPRELRLLLIDPKMVELTHYNDIPHLITPVLHDAKAATAALRWVIDEMETRFNTFNEERVRDIDAYNKKVENDADRMPYIVIVVDEFADLMAISSQHVEDAVKRLTQKARACGIHLIIATQRPSTDVIKGTIKSNIPTRIAFMVSSHVDSQTIIDSSGADKLLGRGDMLFLGNGMNKIRVQGAFVSESDIEKVTSFIRQQMAPDYVIDADTLIKHVAKRLDRDEHFEDVARYVVSQNEASINKISKHFQIGFNRAQSIVEALEEIGVVSEHQGSRAREVLVDPQALETLLGELG